ncbi:MAG: hypothetical protein MUC92_09340 [Fimbriimonadaceae bacterium]|nr:hypothetical protein [Fimbriimonadaceae bacterium]
MMLRFPEIAALFLHTPEFEEAKSLQFVERVAGDWNISVPILNDPESVNWTNFANAYWPRVYVVNQRGQIVFDWIGEGGEEELAFAISCCLGNPLPSPPLNIDSTLAKREAEVFFGMRGFENGQAPSLGVSPWEISGGTVVEYQSLEHGTRFNLKGQFRIEMERLVSLGAGYLQVPTRAKTCSLVIDVPVGGQAVATIGESAYPIDPGFGMKVFQKDLPIGELHMRLSAGCSVYACCFGD